MRITLPRLGLGGAPLGNMFHSVDEATADLTLSAAWDAGIRLYDTSPHYGAGLSEQRYGRLLSKKPRDQFVLSSKVGRLLKPAARPENAKPFVDELPNARILDYSADGARRSIEDSLQRLDLERIDIVYIHDVSEDQHGPKWREYFAEAMQGAAKALTAMREEGTIGGWGLGVNLIEPCQLALQQSDPDLFLLAGRYTLLDHADALRTLLPQCLERGVGIVVGGPFNSGVLAGGGNYDYAPADAPIRHKVERLSAICERFGVEPGAAALQFCLAHPAVAAAIPGSANPQRPAQYLALLDAAIPADFWLALRQEGVLAEEAPTPAKAASN